MAITDAYFTKEEYYAAMKKPLSTADEDTAVDRGAISVSQFLNRISNQFFGKDAAPVERTFRASNDRYLDVRQDGVPGIATATGLVVTVNGVVLNNATDLVLLPLNADMGPLPMPFNEIELLDTGAVSSFYSTNGFITITAVWGWPAVPAIVKDTAIELLGIWRGESQRSTGRMNELDQVVNESPMGMQIVNRFLKAIRTPVVA